MMMKGGQRLWTRMFGKYLWLTNTVSCGGLLAVGDVIQQRIEYIRGINPSYNWRRTGRLFVVGLSQGPPHHVFYVWLDKVFPQKTARVIFKKIMMDQLLGAPFFAITFFLGAGMLEGKSFGGALNEFKEKFPAVYAFDWCIWPPTQTFNFYLVPVQYRVLYINFITVIWDIFLSYMKHKDQVVNQRKVD